MAHRPAAVHGEACHLLHHYPKPEHAKHLAWISAATLSTDFRGVQIKSARGTSLLVQTAAPTTDLITVTTEQSPSTPASTNTAAFPHVLSARQAGPRGKLAAFH